MKTLMAILLLILLTFLVLSFIGCTITPVENLKEPNNNDWHVVVLTKKHIHLQNAKGEIMKLKNRDNIPCKPGDVFILENVYRYNIYNNR